MPAQDISGYSSPCLPKKHRELSAPAWRCGGSVAILSNSLILAKKGDFTITFWIGSKFTSGTLKGKLFIFFLFLKLLHVRGQCFPLCSSGTIETELRMKTRFSQVLPISTQPSSPGHARAPGENPGECVRHISCSMLPCIFNFLKPNGLC